MQDVQSVSLSSFQELKDQQLINAVWEKVKDVPILTPEFLTDNLKENEFEILAQKLNLSTPDPSVICNEFNRIKSSQYMMPSQYISSYSTVPPASAPTGARYYQPQPQNTYQYNYPLQIPVQQHFPPKKSNKVAFLSMYPVHQLNQGQIPQPQPISHSQSATPAAPVHPKPIIKHRIATAIIPQVIDDKNVPKSKSIPSSPPPPPQPVAIPAPAPPKKVTRTQVAKLAMEPQPAPQPVPQRDEFGEDLAEHVSLIVERLQRISDNICSLQKSVVRVNAKLETIECA